jgi:hypothetical protein
MCADCQHWKRREAFEHYGLTFAPCALRPDAWVKDSRMEGGRIRQEYVTESTYRCDRFAKSALPDDRVNP